MNNVFQISNHPVAQNVQRKIVIIGVYPDVIQKSIRCPFFIQHYIDGQLDETFFKTEFASMFTNNNKYVNLQGERVELVEETYIEGLEEIKRFVAPEGSIPEYDFLAAIKPNPEKGIEENLMDLVAFMVKRNDEMKNFDNMANFRE